MIENPYSYKNAYQQNDKKTTRVPQRQYIFSVPELYCRPQNSCGNFGLRPTWRFARRSIVFYI